MKSRLLRCIFHFVYWPAIIIRYTILEKEVVTPQNGVLFGGYSYSICLWGLKVGWLVGLMVYLWIVCTIVLNVYFKRFVVAFIDIREIGWMSIPKCHWIVTMENLVKERAFCMMLPVGVALCMPGQYWIFPALPAIIAARRRGMLSTVRCRRSIGIATRLSSKAWQSSRRFRGGLSTLVIAWPKYVLWGCSLAILQAAQSCWHCPDEGNQGRPEHDRVCYFRVGSGSYPRNAAWQMVLRCFAKALYRSLATYLSGRTRADLAQLRKARQTCTEPPSWTLWAWHICWKC